MNKFKIVLIIIICSVVSKGYSQYTFTSYKHKYFTQFFSTETLIPITGIESIDNKVKEKLAREWAFTKLRFVPLNEIYRYTESDNVSIIDLFSFDVNAAYGNTSLCLYIPAKLNDTRMTNVIAASPIKCGFSGNKKFMSECDYEQLGYKIDILLTQLIEVVEFTKKEKYIPTLAHVSGVNKYIEKYNEEIIKTTQALTPKTLLLSESFLNPKMNAIKFKQLYSYNCKIVSQNEYEEIVNSNNKEYLILLQGNVPNSIISVFDFEKMKTLYIGLNFAKTPLARISKLSKLNEKQVKRLNAHMNKLALAKKD